MIVGLASSALLPLLGAIVDHTSGEALNLFSIVSLILDLSSTLILLVCNFHNLSSKIDRKNFSNYLLRNSLSHDLPFGIDLVRSCNFINHQCFRRLDSQRDVICILAGNE